MRAKVKGANYLISSMPLDVDADFTGDLIYNKTAAIKGGVLYGSYSNQKD